MEKVEAWKDDLGLLHPTPEAAYKSSIKHILEAYRGSGPYGYLLQIDRIVDDWEVIVHKITRLKRNCT